MHFATPRQDCFIMFDNKDLLGSTSSPGKYVGDWEENINVVQCINLILGKYASKKAVVSACLSVSLSAEFSVLMAVDCGVTWVSNLYQPSSLFVQLQNLIQAQLWPLDIYLHWWSTHCIFSRVVDQSSARYYVKCRLIIKLQSSQSQLKTLMIFLTMLEAGDLSSISSPLSTFCSMSSLDMFISLPSSPPSLLLTFVKFPNYQNILYH